MNWKIKQIKILNSLNEGTIVNASYSVTDGISTIFSDVNLLPVNSEFFIDLSNVTENKVIEFVKDALNANQIEGDISGTEKIEALVLMQKNTPLPEVMPLPWE
jgi:hypothetical protein